jgi:hypothetical protein
MKVTVAQGFQCVHDGTVHDGGDTAEVPGPVAQFWIRSGWATEVKAEAKPLPRRKPPARRGN